jgi:hypothetical protein
MDNSFGKTIELFLVDGTPTGLITAQIKNWSLKTIIASRSEIVRLNDRADVHRPGVYFLVGADTEDLGEHYESVYIGESENVYKRLVRHVQVARGETERAKDFWDKTIIFTSSEDHLTKSHIRYVESRLINMAIKAGRSNVMNGTSPPVPVLRESAQSDMEAFLAQIVLLLPVLGYSFLRPAPSRSISSETSISEDRASLEVEFTYGGVEAFGIFEDGEILVLEGSTMRKETTSSFPARDEQIRANLIEQEIIVDSSDPDFYVFTEDYLFGSPSGAGRLLGGSTMNGWNAWRIRETGQTLAEWRDAEVIES